MHSNNPVLQTHLQSFIALCNKYSTAHQSSDVASPSFEPTISQASTEVTTTPKPQTYSTNAPSPVTPDDLQKWQQTIQRIEAVQNDLSPEEISAFSALVSLFNIGNFGANESDSYIRVLKNSTTKNRLLQRIYLPTFVALCEKYFKTQVTPINVPSNSGVGVRQTSTSGQTKKSGSNSMLILIIVAIILGVGYYMV